MSHALHCLAPSVIDIRDRKSKKKERKKKTRDQASHEKQERRKKKGKSKADSKKNSLYTAELRIRTSVNGRQRPRPRPRSPEPRIYRRAPLDLHGAALPAAGRPTYEARQRMTPARPSTTTSYLPSSPLHSWCSKKKKERKKENQIESKQKEHLHDALEDGSVGSKLQHLKAPR
jgi:hypothetical protein